MQGHSYELEEKNIIFYNDLKISNRGFWRKYLKQVPRVKELHNTEYNKRNGIVIELRIEVLPGHRKRRSRELEKGDENTAQTINYATKRIEMNQQ